MPDRSPSAPDPATHPDDVRARVLLGMLHSARNRGDRDAAQRAWLLIVGAEAQRVRGIVAGYRHDSLPGGRIPAAEIDDVASDVFVRLHDKVDTLRGRSVGELRAFMREATKFTCLDYVRDHVRDDQRRGGSLDAPRGDDGAGAGDGASAGRGSRAATDAALLRLAQGLAADDDEAEIARAVIHPALALVDDDKRGVLVMAESGYSTAEIMERFGISRDNVYQRRRRALTQLRDAILELAEEDEAS